MTYSSDDLTPLLLPPPGGNAINLGQGVVVSWDPATFDNEILYRGATLTNLSILGSLEGISLAPGDVVGIWSWRNSYFIGGRMRSPASGRGVFIRDGGRFETRHIDETLAVAVGTLFDPGMPNVQGINFQARARTAVLFRAEQGAEATSGSVFMGDGSAGDDGIELDNIICTSRVSWLSSRDGNGDVILGFPVSGVDEVFIDAGTTASAANAVIDAGTGLVQRSTSSARRKLDIEPYAPDPAAVLALQPRTFRDLGEATSHPEIDRRHVGFVAEEVAEAMPEAVDLDELGRPDAISLPAIVAGLVALCKSQHERIEALERRLGEPTAPSAPTAPNATRPLAARAPMPPRERQRATKLRSSQYAQERSNRNVEET